MEFVIDFVQMGRFVDPLQIEVLEAMRTPGGKKITEEAWQATTVPKACTTRKSNDTPILGRWVPATVPALLWETPR